MTQRSPIPVPLSQRWKAFRIGVLPLVSFVAACAIAMVMWNRQTATSTSTGEVWAERVEIAVSVDGVLAQWPSRRWQLFDAVNAGDIMARLDDRATLAQIATVSREIKQAEEELTATDQSFRLERSDRDFERVRERQGLMLQIEQRRLAIAERRALLLADRVEVARLREKLDMAEQFQAKQAIRGLDFQDVLREHDVVKARIGGHEQFLVEATAVLKEQQHRLSQQDTGTTAEAEKALLPLRATIAVQEARLGELEIQRDLLTVRAPISGHITTITAYPGQTVRAGTILYTLASDDAQYIVSYVRQNQRMQPAVGMPVTIRSRLDTTLAANSNIDRIGPQVELVPAHQLRDQSQKVLEWGLPVRIPVPRALKLRPGELVDLRFITNGQPPAAGQEALLAEQG